MSRTVYRSDGSDDEWASVAPYLTPMDENAPQRPYPLRQAFNGLRFIVRTGMQWRLMPDNLPPWPVVYQQRQGWIRAGVVEVAFVDQGCTGAAPAAAAEGQAIRLEAVKLSTVKRGFVRLPRRWVVGRSLVWVARLPRLARPCERLAETLVGLHSVAFAMLMAHRFVTFMVQRASQAPHRSRGETRRAGMV